VVHVTKEDEEAKKSRRAKNALLAQIQQELKEQRMAVDNLTKKTEQLSTRVDRTVPDIIDFWTAKEEELQASKK
jgi:ABC-type transporter Mla subunit MlaD